MYWRLIVQSTSQGHLGAFHKLKYRKSWIQYRTCTLHKHKTYKHNRKVGPFGIALVKMNEEYGPSGEIGIEGETGELLMESCLYSICIYMLHFRLVSFAWIYIMTMTRVILSADWLIGGWIGGWVGGWMDGWMDGWVDGWMGGWTDGWIDGLTYGMDGWMDG